MKKINFFADNKRVILGSLIGLVIGLAVTGLFYLIAFNPQTFPTEVVYALGFTIGILYTLSAWIVHSFICTSAGCVGYAFFISWILYALAGGIVGKVWKR